MSQNLFERTNPIPQDFSGESSSPHSPPPAMTMTTRAILTFILTNPVMISETVPGKEALASRSLPRLIINDQLGAEPSIQLSFHSYLYPAIPTNTAINMYALLARPHDRERDRKRTAKRKRLGLLIVRIRGE